MSLGLAAPSGAVVGGPGGGLVDGACGRGRLSRLGGLTAACKERVSVLPLRNDGGVEIATVAERPELIELAVERTRDTLPEYNNHGDVLNRYWGRLTEERPDFQFHLLGDNGDLLARARSIPLRWDGSVSDLPAGIDGAIARGFDEAGANALCALVIMVPRDVQGRGISAAAVKAMGEIARRHGLAALIAPVRPSWKVRYPLVAIERYARWRRPDGLPFDPWMRVHARLGARVLKPEPRSLRITGTVAEWEQWTQMSFPESGDYWFPDGLATVAIDRDAGTGAYWEPNVWTQHTL
jgi:GNAT superfamily N-acetyltransferase